MSDSMERPPTLAAMPTYLASRVTVRVRTDLQRALAEYGLLAAGHGVLVALADFGALSQQQLADGLDADKSHVVRLIDQLEARRLVRRAADPTDRRRHRITLTGAGRKLVETVAPIVKRIEDAHLAVLSDAERATLASLLRRVLDAQDQARGSDSGS